MLHAYLADNLIKIWRLYPYAQESLAPLMTLYCVHTPVYTCMLKGKLAVAFHDHTSATYSIVMYNLKNRNRLDHSAADDHRDSITGIAGESITGIAGESLHHRHCW